MQSTSARVGLQIYLVVGVTFGIFSVAAVVGAFLAKQYWMVAVFAAFALLAIFLTIGAGAIELSEDAVCHENIFGRFRMPWVDIRSIECGTLGTLVLHGENKRFALLPPGWWSGNEKVNAIELLRRKVQKPGLMVYSSNVADYKIHKNVRIHPTEA